MTRSGGTRHAECRNDTVIARGDGALIAPLESRMSSKGSSPVRRGAAETVLHGNRADRPPYVVRHLWKRPNAVVLNWPGSSEGTPTLQR
jgi:hypothetical protein